MERHKQAFFVEKQCHSLQRKVSSKLKHLDSSWTLDTVLCPCLLEASVTSFLETLHRKHQTQAWSAQCNPSTQGAEADRRFWVQGQTRLHRNFLDYSKNYLKKKREEETGKGEKKREETKEEERLEGGRERGRRGDHQKMPSMMSKIPIGTVFI